jgi:hypothetical protein
MGSLLRVPPGGGGKAARGRSRYGSCGKKRQGPGRGRAGSPRTCHLMARRCAAGSTRTRTLVTADDHVVWTDGWLRLLSPIGGSIRVGLTRCSICSGIPATTDRLGFRLCEECDRCVRAGERDELARPRRADAQRSLEARRAARGDSGRPRKVLQRSLVMSRLVREQAHSRSCHNARDNSVHGHSDLR